jgi:hypothetical protein
MRETPDSWIESPANGGICDDAGICGNCLKPLDNGCECIEEEREEEREEGPTLQEREEEYLADLGEARYQESLDE